MQPAIQTTGGYMTTTYQEYFGAELPKATALVSNIPKKLMDQLWLEF